MGKKTTVILASKAAPPHAAGSQKNRLVIFRMKWSNKWKTYELTFRIQKVTGQIEIKNKVELRNVRN